MRRKEEMTKMIKISANLSKKVPLPNVGYSSQQFGGSIEIEVGDSDSADAIHEKMRRLYTLLNRAVDEQINKTAKAQAPEHAPGNGNGNGNGSAPATKPTNGTNRLVQATAAQQKAIFAICRSKGVDMAAVLAGLNVTNASELSVRAASNLIDELKQGE
jgi:hypothetical protein